MAEKRVLILTGFMGSGKTTVGKKVSSWLKIPFFDMDSIIEEEEGMKIKEIFESRGEPYFREKETSLLTSLLERGRESPCIIATGGGSLIEGDNMNVALQSGVVVYLETSLEEVEKRLGETEIERPLYRGKDSLYSLFEKREPIYRKADIIIKTDGRRVESIAGEIIRVLRERGSELLAHSLSNPEEFYSMRRVGIDLKERSYDILIGAEVLPDFGDILRREGVLPDIRRVAIVTAPPIAELYLEPLIQSLYRADISSYPIIIPDGEESKSMTWVTGIIDSLIAANFERQEVIIAFGGGVIGDIASFVASIYLRGVPLIQFPTTLLSQVDSSVGGKTGVNTKAGKNLIGTFYQPSLVFIDTGLLMTLNSREFNEGMTEVIKYGLILDEDLFSFIRERREEIHARKGEIMIELVSRCCRIKGDIVKRDERDRGVRGLLNLGHTLGHVIENVEGYGNLRHGEAVSIGIVFSLFVSMKKGFIDSETVRMVIEVLRWFEQPVHIRNLHRNGSVCNIDDLMRVIRRDKKVGKGRLNFVVIRAIGKADFLPLEFDELKELLSEWSEL